MLLIKLQLYAESFSIIPQMTDHTIDRNVFIFFYFGTLWSLYLDHTAVWLGHTRTQCSSALLPGTTLVKTSFRIRQYCLGVVELALISDIHYALSKFIFWGYDWKSDCIAIHPVYPSPKLSLTVLKRSSRLDFPLFNRHLFPHVLFRRLPHLPFGAA